MLFEHLAKVASVLDSVGTRPARQAAEGIDTVLGLYANAAKAKDSKEDKALKAQVAAAVSKIDRPLANALNVLRKVVKECSRSSAPCSNTLHRHLMSEANNLETLLLNLRDSTREGGLAASAEIRAMEDLTKVADLFDEEGLHDAAGILDSIVREAAELPNYPSRWSQREGPYDSDKNNKDSMYAITRREVDENRKQHHLETHRPMGYNETQTRYDPEVPGAPVLRQSDGVYQSMLTKKVYDYNLGWTDEEGNRRPGGSVKNQTPQYSQYANPSRMFDGRVNLSKSRG